MTVRLINNLWKIIISNLDCDGLRAMSCVDKNFNKLCAPKELWKKNVLATEKESVVQLLEHAENSVENPWKMWHLTKCLPPVKEIDGPEKFAMIKKVDKIRKLDQLNVRGGLIPFYFGESYTLRALFKDSKGEYVVITKDGEETNKPPPGEDDDDEDMYGGEDQYTIKFYIGYFDSVNKVPIEEGYVKSGFCAYKGGFKNGYFHGKGEFHYPMGVYYSDNWETSDIKNGVMAWFKGGWYEGEFKRMELTGFGKYVGDTNYILEGFRGTEGEISGAGTVTDPSGYSFKANFSNGKICDPLEIFIQRINPSTRKCIENGWCTRQYTKKVFFPQPYYYCNTCNITSEKGLGLCSSCYKNCHKDKGHNVEESPTIAYAFFCDCKIESTCFCFEDGKDYNSNFDNNVEPFIIYYDKLPVELRKTK